jgi:hypothetical protein
MINMIYSSTKHNKQLKMCWRHKSKSKSLIKTQEAKPRIEDQEEATSDELAAGAAGTMGSQTAKKLDRSSKRR